MGEFDMAGSAVSGRRLLSGALAAALLFAFGAAACAGPLNVQSISVSPNALAAGTTATVTVRLNTAAPPGGQVVGIACGPQLSGPRTVNIAAGAKETTLQVTAGNPPSQTNTFVRAFIGQAGQVANVTVRPAAGSYTLESIQVRPSPLRGGETGSLQIRLSGPAPAAGVNVQLSSSDPRAMTVPSSVRLVSGARSATVTVKGGALAEDTSVTITAMCQDVNKSCQVTVLKRK